MAIDLSVFDEKPVIDETIFNLENGDEVAIDILRLDQIHDTISGNKWFKLKYNLQEAEKQKADTILSFGGAYSNHLHALAYAGKLFNLRTIGIVRGEEVCNSTLDDCKLWGMELHYISRTEYRKKNETDFLNKLYRKFSNTYIIPEGGDNELGAKGCTEILNEVYLKPYEILCCPIGTGTTIKGLSKSFSKEIFGFAPFKNASSLKKKLCSQIPNLKYIDDYHFGGFGKTTEELLNFIEQLKNTLDIELDKIYTAKMIYGLEDLLNKKIIQRDKKILVIHTGGLQGNRSFR